MKHTAVPPADDAGRVRLDKWLWAARFFQTRRLAVEAIAAGQVRVNGNKSKPGHEVRVGECIAVQKGSFAIEVHVQALSAQRGPASVAQTLYAETPESTQRREELRQQKAQGMAPGGERPTKRERRELDRWRWGA